MRAAASCGELVVIVTFACRDEEDANAVRSRSSIVESRQLLVVRRKCDRIRNINFSAS